MKKILKKIGLGLLIGVAAVILILAMIPRVNSIKERKALGVFYTKLDGAELPVMVAGNLDSPTYIIYLAGGPGEASFNNHFALYMNELEKNYAVVYYDQRCCGRAKGRFDKDRLTLQQFTEDTDHIVDLVKKKYSDPDIVLLGHSWGGALGTAYLLDEEHQRKIKGWIDLDGGHNWAGLEKESRKFAIDYLEGQLDGESPQEVLELLDWYEENPVIGTDNIFKHFLALNGVHAYKPESAEGDNIYLYSPNEPLFSYYYNGFYAAWKVYRMAVNMDVYSINLTPEMHNITLPSLILWGELDYRISKDFGTEAYETIRSENKKLVIMPHSGHTPVREDIPLFVSSIEGFIESL